MESGRSGTMEGAGLLPLLDQHDSSPAIIKVLDGKIQFLNQPAENIISGSDGKRVTGSLASEILGSDLMNTLDGIMKDVEIPPGKIGDPDLVSDISGCFDTSDMKTEIFKITQKEFMIILHQDIAHIAGLFHNNHNMIISTVRDLIVKVDRDGILTFASRSYTDLFGDQEDILGGDFMPLIHEDDREVVRRSQGKLRNPPHVCSHEERAMTRKGWRWLAWSNKAVFTDNGDYDGFIGVGRDITEEKSMLDALRSSEERYRSTINAMNDAIHLIDGDNTVLLANKILIKWAKDYGIRDKIVGSNIFDIFPHLDDRIRSEYNRVFTSGRTIVTEETNKLDGRDIVTETRKIPVVEEGEVTKVITILRDVSERSRNRDDLIRLNEILKLINKTMRHDIRNRLFVAYGICGLLNEGHKLDREIIGKAYREIQRSIEITKRMNELEHLMTTDHEMMEIDLREQIETIMNDYEIGYGIEGNATVQADRALESVIDNIVGNSMKHGSAGRIDVRIEEDVDHVYIRISDDGTGIDDSYKDLIFKEGESFGENRGTGLGLYIVKKTMERYGGDIRVEDNKPVGTTFIMMFRKRV